ncbi:MAG: 3-deoxy-7-phosphoheptulonate synthase, partial [Gammaproteobacteria bacterium]
PNYDPDSINLAAMELEAAKLPVRIMVDFSHANSRKQHQVQKDVCKNVAEQISGGERRIFGVMIESQLVPGRQDVVAGKTLVYGQSITDACLGWEDTVPLIAMLAEAVRERRGLKK